MKIEIRLKDWSTTAQISTKTNIVTALLSLEVAKQRLGRLKQLNELRSEIKANH